MSEFIPLCGNEPVEAFPANFNLSVFSYVNSNRGATRNPKRETRNELRSPNRGAILNPKSYIRNHKVCIEICLLVLPSFV